MSDTWRVRSQACIRETVLMWADSYGSMPSRKMPVEQKAKLLKMVRAAYPFGQRSMFPYKVWLEEVRKFKYWLYWEPKPIDDGLFEAAGCKGEDGG